MWADRVVVLKDGSIVDDRSTAEFAGPAELSSFYAVSYTHLDVYKRQGHGLLEGFHPCAGFGQVSGQDGKGSQNDVGKGHSKPHHGQAEHDAQRRLEHGRADSLAQERSAARGGDCLLYTSRCV